VRKSCCHDHVGEKCSMDPCRVKIYRTGRQGRVARKGVEAGPKTVPETKSNYK